MKKLLYFLIAIVFFSTSCDKENEIEKYNLGTEFFISDGGYTSLDNEVTFTVENQNKNLSQITVTHLGGMTTNENADGELIPFDPPKADLGTITVSDGSGAITISDTDLGMTTIGWSADFSFNTTFDGKDIIRYHSITVSDPISVEEPTILHTDSAFAFLFSVDPASATLTGTTVETKVFYNGSYSSLSIIEGAEGKKDTVFLNGLDYNIGDTVYVKITATTATKTASTVTEMVVAPYSYDNVDEFMLDTTSNQAFNLDSAEYVHATNSGDTADIEFTAAYPAGTGPVIVGFVSHNNAEFVAATADDYSNADIVDIEATNFSSAVQAVPDAQEGDVYIYRTRRGTSNWSYGILKVIKVDKPQGVLEDSSITIEYKH